MFRRALLVFFAVLVTGALTVGGADATSAGKFRVVIEDVGSVSSFAGRFVLYAPTAPIPERVRSKTKSVPCVTVAASVTTSTAA